MAGVRQAVLIPGRGYTTNAPLLAYAAEALRRRGVQPYEIEWQVPADLSAGEPGPWVRQQVMSALTADTLLLVAKSLGTLAAPLAAERNLPAVWLTPLLRYPEVVEALERAPAPFLLVGGTADALWDGATARRLTPHVLEVEGGDHSLLVPGPLARSAEVLGRISTAIEEFAGRLS